MYVVQKCQIIFKVHKVEHVREGEQFVEKSQNTDAKLLFLIAVNL